MSNSDSERLVRPRVDEDQPTLIDPALHSIPAPGSSVRHSAGPAVVEGEKTVLSQRPPTSAGWSASNSAMELGARLEGKQLGHFTLEKFVGGGGMGAVFRGTDNLLGRIVAVKVLSRDQGADPETLRRFKNEAQSAARLDHDNIARVFFVGEDDGWNYIVFEYIDGTNIRDLVDRDGPLPLELAIDFTIQIADALGHAAERDVVHRDIKPSNILVTADRHAKLVDMGLARLHQMEAGESDLTASGVTLGTFDYISPEQASDPRRADVRSDLYSLGCTLFFMLAARPPFPQGTVLQKLLAHSGEAPPDPREDRPDLPEAVTKIVHRLMAKRPEQRYREPAELVRDLLVLRDRLGLARYGAVEHSADETAASRWRDRALAWGAPLALLAICFLSLNAFWANWNSQADSLPAFRKPANGLQPVAAPERAPGESPSAEGDGADASVTANSSTAHNGGTESNGAVASARSNSLDPTETNADNEPDIGDSPLPPHELTVPAGSDSTPGGNAAVDDPHSAPPSPGNSTPGEASDQDPTRLVVIGDASKLGDMGETVAIFASLGDALGDARILARLPQIEAIEVRTPLVLERAPLDIALPKNVQLTIRGVPLADGELPRVRFEAVAARSADFSGALVNIAGGKAAWEALHLEWDVGEIGPSDELALLRLAAGTGAHLELRHCVFTIDNPPAGDAPSVAFIDIQTLGEEATAGVVPINLRDAIFRGRATLVRMRESVGLDLDWNNGLLASNSPLLAGDGARRPFDESGDGTIRLRLDDVTISTSSDLCQLRDSAAKPHQPALELECNRCIVAVGGSVIEHDGHGDAEAYAESLHISGSHNFYEGVDVFYRAYVDDVEQRTWDWLAWKKQLMRDGMPSYTGPVRWGRSRSDVLAVPLHLQGIDDYALDPAASNPAVRDSAGFVAKLLPPLVRVQASAPPAETTSGGGASP